MEIKLQCQKVLKLFVNLSCLRLDLELKLKQVKIRKSNFVVLFVLISISCSQNDSNVSCIGEKQDLSVCFPNDWKLTDNDDYYRYVKIDSFGNYLMINRVYGTSSNIFYNYIDKTNSLFSHKNVILNDYSTYDFKLNDCAYLYSIYDYKSLNVNKKFVSVIVSIDNEVIDISLSVDSVFYDDYKAIFDKTILPSVSIYGEKYFSTNILPLEINEVKFDYLDSLINHYVYPQVQ